MKTLCYLLVKFILYVGKIQWVVFDTNAPGFILFGIRVEYYKCSDTAIIYKENDKEAPTYRKAEKRELCKGIKFNIEEQVEEEVK